MGQGETNVWIELKDAFKYLFQSAKGKYSVESYLEVLSEFTDEQINSTNDFENKKGISYALIKSSDKVDKVSISINPGEGDVVIENDFFIGVMNFDISNDFNISSIFCGIVNI